MGDTKEAGQVKGWRINLTPYQVRVPIRDSEGNPVMRNGAPIIREDTLDVVHNLCTTLFNTNLRLKPEDMFKTKDIVDKIRAAKSGRVILDDAEMELLRKAYNALTGLPEHFIEFLRRIRDAEQVELMEVEPKN